MDDFVDGVMIKLKATGGSYDSYTHKRFLQSTCGYLRAKANVASKLIGAMNSGAKPISIDHHRSV